MANRVKRKNNPKYEAFKDNKGVTRYRLKHAATKPDIVLLRKQNEWWDDSNPTDFRQTMDDIMQLPKADRLEKYGLLLNNETIASEEIDELAFEISELHTDTYQIPLETKNQYLTDIVMHPQCSPNSIIYCIPKSSCQSDSDIQLAEAILKREDIPLETLENFSESFYDYRIHEDTQPKTTSLAIRLLNKVPTSRFILNQLAKLDHPDIQVAVVSHPESDTDNWLKAVGYDETQINEEAIELVAEKEDIPEMFFTDVITGSQNVALLEKLIEKPEFHSVLTNEIVNSLKFYQKTNDSDCHYLWEPPSNILSLPFNDNDFDVLGNHLIKECGWSENEIRYAKQRKNIHPDQETMFN